MENEWEFAEYRIRLNAGDRILSSWVRGKVRDGFGIHEIDCGWSVTHLRTGWNAFTCPTEAGALSIASHLIEHYRSEFGKLVISGARVSNFRSLEEKIKADGELTELRRLYAYSVSQLRAMGVSAKQKIEIVS